MGSQRDDFLNVTEASSSKIAEGAQFEDVTSAITGERVSVSSREKIEFSFDATDCVSPQSSMVVSSSLPEADIVPNLPTHHGGVENDSVSAVTRVEISDSDAYSDLSYLGMEQSSSAIERCEEQPQKLHANTQDSSTQSSLKSELSLKFGRHSSLGRSCVFTDKINGGVHDPNDKTLCQNHDQICAEQASVLTDDKSLDNSNITEPALTSTTTFVPSVPMWTPQLENLSEASYSMNMEVPLTKPTEPSSAEIEVLTTTNHNGDALEAGKPISSLNSASETGEVTSSPEGGVSSANQTVTTENKRSSKQDFQELNKDMEQRSDEVHQVHRGMCEGSDKFDGRKQQANADRKDPKSSNTQDTTKTSPDKGDTIEISSAMASSVNDEVSSYQAAPEQDPRYGERFDITDTVAVKGGILTVAPELSNGRPVQECRDRHVQQSEGRSVQELIDQPGQQLSDSPNRNERRIIFLAAESGNSQEVFEAAERVYRLSHLSKQDILELSAQELVPYTQLDNPSRSSRLKSVDELPVQRNIADTIQLPNDPFLSDAITAPNCGLLLKGGAVVDSKQNSPPGEIIDPTPTFAHAHVNGASTLTSPPANTYPTKISQAVLKNPESEGTSALPKIRKRVENILPSATIEPSEPSFTALSNPKSDDTVMSGVEQDQTSVPPRAESRKTATSTSFSAPNGSQSKDVLMAELKAMKIASLKSRNTALEAEIALKRSEVAEITKDLKNPAAETVKRHIKLLHDYNDIRDVGQGLIGMIADNRGVRIGELYEEFGVGLKD